jgi:hypothetical protein
MQETLIKRVAWLGNAHATEPGQLRQSRPATRGSGWRANRRSSARHPQGTLSSWSFSTTGKRSSVGPSSRGNEASIGVNHSTGAEPRQTAERNRGQAAAARPPASKARAATSRMDASSRAASSASRTSASRLPVASSVKVAWSRTSGQLNRARGPDSAGHGKQRTSSMSCPPLNSRSGPGIAAKAAATDLQNYFRLAIPG